MTLGPKTITVKCPQCQRVYIDWHVPAVSEQDSHKPTTVCSKCGHRSKIHELSDRNGTLQM
ncbi:MAG: hypothetical protein WA885_04060 [Phormidesmis sp.]